MRKYPSISDNPGLEAWVEDGEWSRKEVFRKINNYNFPPPNTAARYHSTAPTAYRRRHPAPHSPLSLSPPARLFCCLHAHVCVCAAVRPCVCLCARATECDVHV